MHKKTDKKRTIAIFAAHFPPEPGGIAKFMGITSDALANLGCNVIVVTSDYGNPNPDNEGVTLVKLPIHSNWYGSSRYPIIRGGKGLRSCVRMLDSMNIDKYIALTRFHSTSHFAAKYARRHQKKLYLVECGANPLTVNNRFIDFGIHVVEKILTKRIKSSVRSWGAMSKAGVEFLKNQYGVNADFIWPCSIQVPDNVQKTASKNYITITYSGRIENLKGEDELAKSFTDLAVKYKNIRLNFLGDGSYLSTLKEKYNNPNIKYWGNVSPQTVHDVNLATDISVCATRFPDGAVPNSVLEAGAVKCALITSPNGGFTDLMVNEHNGLLTTPDLSNMGDCLERLICDEDLRKKLANNIYSDIRENYSSDEVARKIMNDLRKY